MKWAIRSIRCASCMSTGPLGPAAMEFWLSAMGQPAALVIVVLSDMGCALLVFASLARRASARRTLKLTEG